MNEIESLFVEELGYDYWGLPVVRVDGEEYAVAENEEQAQQAAEQAARESLWAFNSSFLGTFLGFEQEHIDAVRKMQEKLCEDAALIVERLLGDRVDEFLRQAIDADGRGHFLSGYDGEENDGEDIHAALTGKLVYRVS